MTETTRMYLPAAGHDMFLPLYDPFAKLIGFPRVQRSLLERADLRADHRVLDLGCGTGSLLVMLKARVPEIEAVGLDPDPKALSRARRKLKRAGAFVRLDQGFADDLPYEDAAFDRVLSTFVLHHLEHQDRRRTFREVRRVLKPGGRFEMVDLGGPHDVCGGPLRRLLHMHANVAENDTERVLALMNDAGLHAPRVVARPRLLFGRVVQYEAERA